MSLQGASRDNSTDEPAEQVDARWDDMCRCDHHRQAHQPFGRCGMKSRFNFPKDCECTAFDLAEANVRDEFGWNPCA